MEIQDSHLRLCPIVPINGGVSNHHAFEIDGMISVALKNLHGDYTQNGSIAKVSETATKRSRADTARCNINVRCGMKWPPYDSLAM